jgi:hypothetical protein
MDVQKKSAHVAEHERTDVAAARTAWFEAQPELDPERLIFIDETRLSTKMTRVRGRAPRGERLRAPIPHGHWRTTTFVAGLRLSGIDAPMVIEGPINGESFLAYVRQVLVPTLRPGDTQREGADVADVSRSLQLAFLAPDLVETILDGTQPVALTSEQLKRAGLPLLWEEQRAALA